MAASDLRISVIDSITRSVNKKTHTVYKVRIETSDGKQWVVYRRYSEFFDFNAKITKKYQTENFSLPKKKLVGNLKAEFIEARRVSLHRYMQRILQHPIVSASPELTEFLAPDVDSEVFDESRPNATSANSADEGAISPSVDRTERDKGSASSSDGPSNSRVSLADFALLKVIGKGSFGKVMLAKHNSTGKTYAIKILNKRVVMQKGELDHVRSERNVLVSAMNHPFLVSMHWSFQTEDKLFFVMDYVNGGEMFFHLQRDKRFSEQRARFYAAEIALGIGHLHSQGIVYRDLKPENILIGADGHIILTDFGLCKEGINFGDSTKTFCGTPEYLAPEVLRNEEHSLPVDWWCLGIVLYEMLTGLPPFYSEDRNEMYHRTLNDEVYYPTYIAKDAKELLVGLLKRQPGERLGSGPTDVEELKSAAFFKGINWDRLLDKQIKPPWMPKVKGEGDVSNIDQEFLAEPVGDVASTGPALSESLQNNFTGFTFAEPSAISGAAAAK